MKLRVLEVLGIDLGKTVFHLVGSESTGDAQEMFPPADTSRRETDLSEPYSIQP